MKRIAIVFMGLGLAACNQTAQQASLEPAAAPGPAIVAGDPPSRATPVPVAVAPAPVQVAALSPEEEMLKQPPIYNPLVDLNGRSQTRFDRDHLACRRLAAPQEKAARDAQSQQAAGTAIAVAGAVASFIPVSGFRSAVNVANASDAAQNLGGAVAEGGAARNAAATEDYALVVNNCLSRRGYILLRG